MGNAVTLAAYKFEASFVLYRFCFLWRISEAEDENRISPMADDQFLASHRGRQIVKTLSL